jgi:hypothetical protein
LADQFGEPGIAGAAGNANAETAKNPPNVKRGDAVGEQKNERGDDQDCNRRQRGRPPTDAVGNVAEKQKRGDVADRICGIDQRQGDLRKANALLVNDVERSNQGAQTKGYTEQYANGG